MNNKQAKVIAFYLPQFHPTAENNEWWGEGFTEWTNVGKAKSYFKGHYQPRVPADLGYYDLRIPEVRERQAILAEEAGIDAFCYWHYWFGDGKQLLEKPLQEVVRLGKPSLPFCLGWANHDWSRKNWNKDISRFNNEFLIRQTYPEKKDIDDHFYKMLPIFSDSRYYRVKGKLLFYIYAAQDIPDIDYFINRWQELAIRENLPGFFFVANCSNLEDIENDNLTQCDAINLDLKNKAFIGKGKWWRRISYLSPYPINVVEYSKAINKWIDPIMQNNNIYPTIIPNWDHSPRSGKSGTILHNSTPELFAKHVENILDLIKDKKDEDKLVFLKSWNEWGEGNYLEPDLKYGKQYIRTLKEVLISKSRM